MSKHTITFATSLCTILLTSQRGRPRDKKEYYIANNIGKKSTASAAAAVLLVREFVYKSSTVNQYFALHFLHAVPQELSVKKSYLFCSASIEFRPQAGRDVYQSIIAHLRHGPRQSKQRYGQGGIQAVCQKSCRRQVRGNVM